MFVQDIDHLNFKIDDLETLLAKEPLVEWAYIIHNKDKKKEDQNNNKTQDLKVREHVHVVLKYKNPQTIKRVAQLFKDKENYVEIWAGRINNAYSYLIHGTNHAQNKHQYEVNEVHASFNFSKRIHEIEEQVKLTNKVNLKEVITSYAVNDIDYDELIETLGIVNVAKNQTLINNIEKIKEKESQKKWLEKFKGHQQVNLWLVGRAGAGKTVYAEKLLRNENYIVLGNSNDYFQNYRGQHYIILNDLRPKNLKYADLLRILDPYSIKYTFGRYHNRPLLSEMIIISSPFSPEQFYNYSSIANKEIDTFEQLNRRVFTIQVNQTFIDQENKYLPDNEKIIIPKKSKNRCYYGKTFNT